VCNAVPGCLDCYTTNSAAANCTTDQHIIDALNAVNACQENCCVDPCVNNKPCNPVTNEGCDVTNMEVCDTDMNGGFFCQGSGTQSICQMCDEGNGPYCNAGMTCVGGECAVYCCNDGDCGPTGVCNMTAGPVDNEMKIGVCLYK
jgi:hypothetical protein